MFFAAFHVWTTFFAWSALAGPACGWPQAGPAASPEVGGASLAMLGASDTAFGLWRKRYDGRQVVGTDGHRSRLVIVPTVSAEQPVRAAGGTNLGQKADRGER